MAYTIRAEQRTETGKSQVRKLRRKGRLPAVMYGHGDPSVLLSLSAREFARLIREIRGHSPIVELEIDGQPATKCVIKTIQRNPLNDEFLHVDFQKVHPHEKLTMNVPVVIRGTAEGVKQGGMLEQLLREVPVRAPIDRIPEYFEIDVTHLKTGHSIHLADIRIDGVEFILPPDSPVVTILTPRKLAAAAAAAAPVAETPAEPEVITEKKAEEEPAETEKKEEKER
ncbi:MAG: 50S ribosomal protein L25 [candidate division WOR-3 bacterium]